MNIYKGVGMFDTMVRDGDFVKAIHLNIEENFELLNKKVLIAGFGRIGKKLIKKCIEKNTFYCNNSINPCNFRRF